METSELPFMRKLWFSYFLSLLLSHPCCFVDGFLAACHSIVDHYYDLPLLLRIFFIRLCLHFLLELLSIAAFALLSFATRLHVLLFYHVSQAYTLTLLHFSTLLALQRSHSRCLTVGYQSLFCKPRSVIPHPVICSLVLSSLLVPARHTISPESPFARLLCMLLFHCSFYGDLASCLQLLPAESSNNLPSSQWTSS